MTFVNLLWLLVRPALLVPPLLPMPLGRHSPSQPLLPVTALTWVPWTDTLLTPWGPRISSTVAWDPRALHTGVGGTALIDKPLRCSSPLLARLDRSEGMCLDALQVSCSALGGCTSSHTGRGAGEGGVHAPSRDRRHCGPSEAGWEQTPEQSPW